MAESPDPKPFDPKAFIAAQNEKQHIRPGQPIAPAAAEGKVEPPAGSDTSAAAGTPASGTPAAGDDDRQAERRLSRSERRAQNRLREELGEERGRRMALEDLLARIPGAAALVPQAGKPAEGAQPVEASDDPEPKQTDFATFAEYDTARTRWEARQEAKKTVTESQKTAESNRAFQQQLADMQVKAAEDKKQFEDWDHVAAEAAEDGPEFNPTEHPQLMMLIGLSDQQAAVLYHFGKHPDELEKMLDLTKKPQDQIRAFHRLEGRLEKLYEKPAAQAAGEETPSKDRSTPEKAGEARATAADRDVRKPRPSAEVAARGGTPPPEEPLIGSKAWMARRNQAQFAR